MPPVIQHVIGPGGNHQRDARAALELQLLIAGADGAAVVNREELRLVFQAVRQRAGKRQRIVFGQRLLPMRAAEHHRARKAAALRCGQAHRHDSRRMTDEILALKRRFADSIAGMRDCVGDVQVAAIIDWGFSSSGCLLPGKIDQQFAKHLIPAHLLVIVGGNLGAGPQAVFVEDDPLLGHAAIDQPAESAVADWQGLVHAGGGGLVVPENLGRSFRLGRHCLFTGRASRPATSEDGDSRDEEQGSQTQLQTAEFAFQRIKFRMEGLHGRIIR